VAPNPLEVHGDSVAFDVTGTLPLKKLKKKRVYTVSGAYEYGDQSIKVADIDYKGTEYPNAKTEAPKVTKHFSFAYKPEIQNGDLNVIGTNFNSTKTKGKSSEKISIAKGLITTSRMVQNYYHVVFADHGYNDREELVPTNVAFFFEQGKSKLRKSESGGKHGKFLDAFIAKKNVTRTVSIVGTHSPEGTEAKNSSLATDRASVIEKYYKERMHHFNQKTWIDSIKFVTKGIILDWEPLKVELDSSKDLSDDEKNQVLTIVNGSGSFESKQDQISKLPCYKKLFSKVYPKLRNAKTEILTVKPKKSRAEIALLAKGIVDGTLKADTLNEAELLYAATLTPILKEKEAIYQASIKKNDSWVAQNNLGAVYLLMAKKEIDENQKTKLVDMAQNALNISVNRKDNPEAHTNLASVHQFKNVRTDVAAEVNKALALSPSDDMKKGLYGVQGVVDIKEGKYDNAIQSLSKSNDSTTVLYNLALANLLKKDFNAAKGGFATVTSKDASNPAAFYLAAVTAARLQDEGGVTSNLKKAVSLNQAYTAKALGDLEFANYWNSENFKNSVK
jgi:tetratricopeptide (TPR) repeat protein